jgi:hypothetical protein
MAPETLAQVKLYLRISHSKLDEAIEGDIESCLSDLRMHGVTLKDDTDSLILNAIKLWCRSIYTTDAAKAAEWERRYIAMRNHLKGAKGYGWEGESNE